MFCVLPRYDIKNIVMALRIISSYPRLFRPFKSNFFFKNGRHLSNFSQLEATEHGDDVVDFDSKHRFYKAKKVSEIIRSVTILKLCTQNIFVRNSIKLMEVTEYLLGEKLFNSLMKKTMYIQFVAGEEYQDIQENIAHLKEHGIRTILMVPTEDDTVDNSDDFESKEEILNRNTELLHDSINKTDPGNFTQMRVSSICSPSILATLSTILLPYETQVHKPNELDINNLARGFDTDKYHLDLVEGLTENQNRHLQNSLRRMDALAKHSIERNVKLLMDAEYFHLEGAIHQMILTLQSKHNKDTPWVYGTYQAYRKDTLDRVKADLQLMSEKGFHFAAKIVRGAYKDSERKRAKDLGYDDPIHDTYEDTCEAYDKIIEIILDRVACTPANVMVATHNEESIKLATQRMAKLGIDKQSAKVSFAQIYGMCDQVSYLLGDKGFEVYKSMPYGPVKTTLPYLARRAQENHDIIKRTKKERSLMWQELGYRILNPFQKNKYKLTQQRQ